MEEPAPERLTPYQGNRRCFGLFNCRDCKRQWGSSNSWANMGQQCLSCNTNIYPHVQFPPRRSRGSKGGGSSKAHPQELCEKCKKVGYYCRVDDVVGGVEKEDKKTGKKKKRSRKKKNQPAAA